jgi:hypothetical protein
MPELVIHAIDCKAISSGIDAGAIQALADVASKAADVGAASAPFFGPEGVAVGEALTAAKGLITSIPGLISAIDKAGNYPDQLYLNLSNKAGKSKIWPQGGKYYSINAGSMQGKWFALVCEFLSTMLSM